MFLSNSPSDVVQLRLEARKSYALHVLVIDDRERGVDITGCILTFTARKELHTAEELGEIVLTTEVSLDEDPMHGYGLLTLQAEDLDLPIDEYPWSLTMRTPLGFSLVLAKGALCIQQNTDLTALGFSFDAPIGTGSLEAMLRGRHVIRTRVGGALPPGVQWYTDEDAAKLDELHNASVLIPGGGAQGELLRKKSETDYDFEWVNPQSYDGTLNAANQPVNAVPLADGSGNWAWQVYSPDITVTWAEVQGKPSLGSAAAADVSSFASAEHTHSADDMNSGVLAPARVPRVSGLRGISSGTSAPTGGEDGDLYFQYS